MMQHALPEHPLQLLCFTLVTHTSIWIEDLDFQERTAGSGKEEDASCNDSIVSYSLCENVGDKAKKDVFGCLLVGFDMLMLSSDV
jgi:hypothetical protein